MNFYNSVQPLNRILRSSNKLCNLRYTNSNYLNCGPTLLKHINSMHRINELEANAIVMVECNTKHLEMACFQNVTKSHFYYSCLPHYLPLLSVNGYINQSKQMFHTLTNKTLLSSNTLNCYESTKASLDQTPETPPTKEVELSRKEKLKRAVKEYGSTVIVFHVGISLISLGICYVVVSSGLDISKVLTQLGLTGSVAANAGTFVTAYAIHKVFAPVRISITLAATPFIVRHLRHIGFLKVPKAR